MDTIGEKAVTISTPFDKEKRDITKREEVNNKDRQIGLLQITS